MESFLCQGPDQFVRVSRLRIFIKEKKFLFLLRNINLFLHFDLSRAKINIFPPVFLRKMCFINKNKKTDLYSYK